MKKKVFCLVAAAVLGLSLLSGCAKQEKAKGSEESSEPSTGTEETYKVGFALMNLENPVWQTMVKGMEAGAEEAGVEFQVFGANDDVATQITNIENMITMGYDAIIVHAFDTEAFADVTKKALDAGIVICGYDDVIRDGATGEEVDYQFKWLCDNYEIGHRVGQMAAEWTKATFEGDDEIPFGLLWTPEFEYHHDRRQGMEDAFSEIDPRIVIVDDQPGYDTEAGAEACEAWLQSYPDMKGVVACGDGPLLGYCEAWTAAGQDIKNPEFGMFGNDGVDDAIDRIYEESILRGDVALDVYSGGSDIVKACVTWIKGGTTEDFVMPMFNATIDTVGEWMANEMLYHGKYSE